MEVGNNGRKQWRLQVTVIATSPKLLFCSTVLDKSQVLCSFTVTSKRSYLPLQLLVTHYTGRWIAENSNVEYNYQLLGIQMMVIGKKNDEEVLPGGRIITPSNYRPLSSTQACVITNPTLLYYTAVFDLWFMID